VGKGSPENFLNFYVKMVSFGAFWVAISYRLAACFTRIGSTCGTEIYWRSFRHFGNCNYSLRKIAKNHKNGPKTDNNSTKIAFLYILRIYSLKIFAGCGLGGATAHSSPMCTPLEIRDCL